MPRICYKSKRFRSTSLARIQQVNTIINEYIAQGYKLTLRQTYYQLVSRDMIPNTQKSYKQLGEIISDGRLAGLIDWSAIEDRTRNVQANSHWDSPGDIVRACAQQFRFDTWEGQTFYVEIMVEKSALEGILEGICTDLDVAYMACRGYMSQSEMWNTAQRLIRKERQDCDTVILHLGDHDPSGLDMTRDIQDRLSLFGSAVDVRRIALNWDQIQVFNPPPNPARALALDTPLPTPEGWTTMGEAAVGDRVIGGDGKPCFVRTKSDVFHGKPCFRFTFAGGDSIVCSGDHLWATEGRKRATKLRTASQIASTWCEGEIQRPVYRVKVAPSLNLSEFDLPYPPYALGAWLGDGSSSDPSRLFNPDFDDQIRLELEHEGFQTKRKSKISVTMSGFRGVLRNQFGLVNNKHIPQMFLRAPEAQRLALLQGLMDTDGTVGKNRGMHTCCFCSTRKVLADGFLELLCSLGIKGRISKNRAACNGVDYGFYWRIEFHPGDFDVFRLKRKRDILRDSVIAERQRWRVLINVESMRSVPTQCISVDSPDHLFLCGQQFIPTHNTTDARYEAYARQYGDESWELDSLEPHAIVDLIRENVEDLCDLDLRETVIQKQDDARQRLEKVADTL